MSLSDGFLHISPMTGNDIELSVIFTHFHTAVIKWVTDFPTKKIGITCNRSCAISFPVFVIADDTDHFCCIVFCSVALSFYQIIAVRASIKTTP